MQFDRLRRRELLGGTAAWPLTASAQRPALPLIGILGSVSPAPYAGFLEAVKQGLRETGYIEGRDVAIQYRWAEGRYDLLPKLATELVGERVAVIILDDRFHETCHMRGIHLRFPAPIFCAAGA